MSRQLSEPLVSATDVVPVIVPLPLIAPVVDAVIVSTVPDTLALIAMPRLQCSEQPERSGRSDRIGQRNCPRSRRLIGQAEICPG